MPHTWTISIGTELTLGQTNDTNAPWLARELATLGLPVRRHLLVPDEHTPLCDVLRAAADQCDYLVLTGGLGPTDDDLTRACLAAVARAPLEIHPPSLDHLRAFFAARGRPMPARNTVQAQVPHGATVLPNSCGTAPGLRLQLGNCVCFALPGVPFEMQRMFTASVAPELRTAAAGATLQSRVLHTFGLGESDIGDRLADLMQRGHQPDVGTTASFGVVSVRINATAASALAAAQMLDQAELEIRRRLGPAIFGRDDQTLATTVGNLLTSANQTVATAESCTGGLIGKLLTDISGSSRYYAGGVITYSNEAKQNLLGVPPASLQEHGAVSATVAGEMADGVARCFGTDYGISATGVAGPTGGTAAKPVGLVFLGLRTPAGSHVLECRFGPDAPRAAIRLRAARTALDLLRRSLEPRNP